MPKYHNNQSDLKSTQLTKDENFAKISKFGNE